MKKTIAIFTILSVVLMVALIFGPGLLQAAIVKWHYHRLTSGSGKMEDELKAIARHPDYAFEIAKGILESPDGNEELAIKILGAVGDDRSVKLIGDLFEKGRTPGYCAVILSNVNNPLADDILAGALNNEKPEVRRPAYSVYIRAKRANIAEATALCRKGLQDESAEVRLSVIAAIVHGLPQGVEAAVAEAMKPELVTMYKSDQPERFKEILTEILVRVDYEPAVDDTIQEMLACLQKGNFKGGTWCEGILEDTRDKSLIPKLWKIVPDCPKDNRWPIFELISILSDDFDSLDEVREYWEEHHEQGE